MVLSEEKNKPRYVGTYQGIVIMVFGVDIRLLLRVFCRLYSTALGV